MSEHLTLQTLPQAQQPSLNSQPALAPITYITQHYHHSAHIVPSPTAPSDTISAVEILAQNDIDASKLFPSQLNLFRTAEPDQRSRLIELWRIAPSTFGPYENGPRHYTWPVISMEQEEEAARQSHLDTEQHGLDHKVEYNWKQQQDGEMQDAQSARPSTQDKAHAEPYVLSGYEELAQSDYNRTAEAQQSNSTHPFVPLGYSRTNDYNRAHDPVYESKGWWQHASESQPMEHQYGAFAMMSEFRASTDSYHKGGGEDEEML